MQTLMAPVWLLAVLGVLAVIGFVAVCWAAAGWAERAADWWHGRRDGGDDEAGLRTARLVPVDEAEDDWALPPERTWEQMTSHQLPVEPPTGPLSVNRERIAPLLGSRQATAHFRRLEKARKRRFMVVSAEIWRAYAAAGLEGTGFTRAMAARVRELAP